MDLRIEQIDYLNAIKILAAYNESIQSRKLTLLSERYMSIALISYAREQKLAVFMIMEWKISHDAPVCNSTVIIPRLNSKEFAN